MLTHGEQQELRQVEEDLRKTDRGFARRLALLQGVLRWAGPGRQAYLLALAVLAAALLRLAGGTAWPGWDSGPEPGHRASPAQGRPQSDSPDLP